MAARTWRVTPEPQAGITREAPRGRRTAQGEEMRKLLTTLLATSVLVFGGVACDDNSKADKIDEDDTNLGPGDGNDEVGPGR